MKSHLPLADQFPTEAIRQILAQPEPSVDRPVIPKPVAVEALRRWSLRPAPTTSGASTRSRRDADSAEARRMERL